VIPLSLQLIAETTGGRIRNAPDPVGTLAQNVSIDSREVQPGDIFAAIQGERVDGHDYVKMALKQGAVAALVQRPVAGASILVEDTVVALGALSRSYLSMLPSTKVIGITGSTGKTSTKDLLAQVLESFGPTVAPVGSFNNEIGLPLTALRATPNTQYLVLEMGARGPGHIAYLTGLTPPTVGLVINVGIAHIGEFGSRERTAEAKGELVEALPPAEKGGIAVLNADDPLVFPMVERTSAKVLTFGTGVTADVRATEISMLDGRASFTIRAGSWEGGVNLRLMGVHHVSNSLAAAAVGLGLGLDGSQIIGALSNAQPRSPGRMEILRGRRGITIVNDAYNANPDSVRAALDAVDAMAAGRRKVLVLGEMAELGEVSESEHRKVGAEAVRRGISLVVGYGAAADPLLMGARDETSKSSLTPELYPVADIEGALGLLRAKLSAGDIVLVKASKAIGLQRLARELCDL
jgi:UDP-N-acetylmuramoyl-tripeptide--D-alanyl-D-alanine ligase